MGCIVKVLETARDAGFQCKRDLQKYLIEFILMHKRIGLRELAELLEINSIELNSVLRSNSYLSARASSLLIQWFLMIVAE